MKVVYPIIIKECKGDAVPYYVHVPDFNVHTQGMDFADAIEMGRDAINLAIVSLEDDGKEIPKPRTIECNIKEEDILTYVDADPQAYRRKLHNLSVKKNCTIPQWLADKAAAANVNFSRVLQDALIDIVGAE